MQLMMGAFEDVRLEALAQALARGLPLHAATREAGYSRQTGMSRRRAGRYDVQTRVNEIKRERLDAAADPAPIIDLLMELGAAAGKLGTAAGMVAARGLLAEAARLKVKLVEEQGPATTYSIVPPKLSKEEWLRAFAPKYYDPAPTAESQAPVDGPR